MSPLETGKALETAIRGDPLGIRLDGHCGEKSVWDEITLGFCGLAELRKDLPMPRPRSQDLAIGLGTEGFNKAQGVVQWARWFEDVGMSRNPQKPAQGEIG
jgi:hypothetical protein